MIPNGLERNSGWSWDHKRLHLSRSDDLTDKVWKAGACRPKFDIDQGIMILKAVH